MTSGLSTHDADDLPEMLAQIGEAVPDFLWLSDADGTPIYQNRAWREYTGLNSESFRQVGWEFLSHPDDLLRLREVWAVALTQVAPLEVEHRVRRHDGAYRWFLSRTAPVIKDDRLVRWVGTLTDIHAQKIAEAELSQAVRLRDEFLAVLAHEVRNPLQALRHAVQVLMMPGIDATEAAHLLTIADAQVTQLSRFMDDTLDSNRVRWDAMSLSPVETTLGFIVDAAVASVHVTVRARAVELDVVVEEPGVAMTVDAGRLIQALTNLLANAVKFSETGGRVVIDARVDAAMATFRITDWGSGIDAATLPRIFNLFERGLSHTVHRPEGFGIGLAVTRHIAALHGGEVRAESRGVGSGSTFTLRVPLIAPPRV
jgi:PAS domain S-box-containing protein